jgi:hypothetical protein
MKLTTKIFAASAICCASVSYAFAAPDPTVADSPAPSTQYKSPFKDYRPLGDDKRTPWRDANDEVGKIGGWRVYLRESQEASKAVPEAAPAVRSAPSAPAAKSPAPDNSNPKPKPSEHAGHGQHN